MKRERESCAAEKMPPAKALDLVDMVRYAEGAVVSRTLAENRAGTLTLFAFDAGQGLSEHSAPFDAIVQVLDGQAVLTIGGRRVPARAGQVVLMPADVPHALQARGPFKMLLTMLRASAKRRAGRGSTC